MNALRVEVGGDSSGHCDCCGNESKTIWGYVRDSEVPVAAYFVHWTERAPGHYPNVDLVIGQWGGESDRTSRVLISLKYQPKKGGGALMVIDVGRRHGSHMGGR